MRDRCADSVRAISPVVERGIESIPPLLCRSPRSRAQVGTVRIHDGDLPARFSISHQLPSQNALGERPVLQLAARAEQIPGGRIGGENASAPGGRTSLLDDFACIAILHVFIGKLRPRAIHANRL